MKQTFTDYVRSLAATGGEPTADAFDELWTGLRRSLARELRRRGLWAAPPSHLGVLGFPAWTTPESRRARGAPSRTRDSLDELTADAYVELFITRGETLRRYVRAGRSIEGVVTTGLRQLLHDRQKRHDRLGFRVFQALRAALEQAVDKRRLHLLGGKTTIHNDTVLSFSPDVEASVVGLDAAEGDPVAEEAPPVGETWPGDEILAREVESWNAEFLSGWITARGDEVAALVAHLEPRLLGLAEAGVEAFRFKTLVDAVKQDLRARLAALWAGRDPLRAREAEGGAAAAGAAGDDPLARMVERDRLRELSDCVEPGLERLPVQRRTREQLRKLWRFLEMFGLAAVDPGLALAQDDAMADALLAPSLPSHRELERLLGLRHDRIPELLARLREVVERCVRVLPQGPDAGTLGGSAGPRGPEASLDDSRDLSQELRRRTAEAYRREREAPPAIDGPRAGELWDIEANPEPGIEWLLLEGGAEEGSGGAGDCLLIPADSLAWAGAADVAVADESALGPLTLRCGYGLWLPEQALQSGGRPGGTVAAGNLERARSHRRQWLAGEVKATAAQRELAVDPDYREWRRTLEAARAAVCKELEGRLDQGPVGDSRSEPALGSAEGEEIPWQWRKRRPIGRFLALAAGIAVLVTGGLLAGRFLEQRRFDSRFADLQAARERLAEERDALARELEDERARSAAEEERLRARHQEEMAALEEEYQKTLDRLDRPELAVPWVLAFGLRRGEPERLVVPPEARSVVLLIDARNGDRVEVHDDQGQVIWSATAERADTPDEVLLRLPARLVPPGEYELFVWRRGGQLEVHFPFQVERP